MKKGVRGTLLQLWDGSTKFWSNTSKQYPRIMFLTKMLLNLKIDLYLELSLQVWIRINRKPGFYWWTSANEHKRVQNFYSLLTQPYIHMFSVFSGDTSPVTRRIKTSLKKAVLYQDGQNVEENVQRLEKLSLYFSLV